MSAGGEAPLSPQRPASLRVDAQRQPSSPPSTKFDPSRSIIRRKALIKDLAAVYHAECLAYCQELLELQTKWEEVNRTGFLGKSGSITEETYSHVNLHEDTRKEPRRQAKRVRKS